MIAIALFAFAMVGANPHVLIATNLGSIEVEVDEAMAQRIIAMARSL